MAMEMTVRSDYGVLTSLWKVTDRQLLLMFAAGLLLLLSLVSVAERFTVKPLPFVTLSQPAETTATELNPNIQINLPRHLFPGIWQRIVGGFELPSVTHSRTDQWVSYFVANPRELRSKQQLAAPYLYYVFEVLKRHGLPAELALLPMIESDYRPRSTSRVGAAGLWQINAITGRHLGLTVEKGFDERYDIKRSTIAAARYLKSLNRRFAGNWLLTLAAYNAGPTRVQRAIDKQGSSVESVQFWSLRLPLETRNYVAKMFALTRIIAEPQRYKVHLRSIVDQPYFGTVKVQSPVLLEEMAEKTGLSSDRLADLNAGYQWSIAGHSEGRNEILVPLSKIRKLSQVVMALPTQFASGSKFNGSRLMGSSAMLVGGSKRLDGYVHTVVSGDTLWDLAKQYRVTVSYLKQLNQLDSGHYIRSGQRLVI